MYKHLIFKDHPAGFFSNFNKVIQNLYFHINEVEKITWQMTGNIFNLYTNNKNEDVYSKLFVPYSNNTLITNILEDIYIDRYVDYTYTAHTVANIYLSEDQNWRTEYNKAYNRFIKFTNFINDTWNAYYASFFNKTPNTPKVGILIRNGLLSTEQPNGRLPTVEQYVQAINTLNLTSPSIVCAVDNLEELAYLSNHFTCYYNEQTTRSKNKYDTEPHSKSSTILDAAFHFLEGVMLSKCDYLIHPVSNMATAALYMNPTLKNTFLIG